MPLCWNVYSLMWKCEIAVWKENFHKQPVKNNLCTSMGNHCLNSLLNDNKKNTTSMHYYLKQTFPTLHQQPRKRHMQFLKKKYEGGSIKVHLAPESVNRALDFTFRKSINDATIACPQMELDFWICFNKIFVKM